MLLEIRTCECEVNGVGSIDESPGKRGPQRSELLALHKSLAWNSVTASGVGERWRVSQTQQSKNCYHDPRPRPPCKRHGFTASQPPALTVPQGLWITSQEQSEHSSHNNPTLSCTLQFLPSSHPQQPKHGHTPPLFSTRPRQRGFESNSTQTLFFSRHTPQMRRELQWVTSRKTKQIGTRGIWIIVRHS